MEIKGFQKITLVDYPGKVGCTIFLGGCDFRCGFCHNRDLVLNYNLMPSIPEKDIIDYLQEKREWIEGVVVSGGEPLLHKDLGGFLSKIKEMGYNIKIDTNGTNPDFLQRLINMGLLDFIAMDVKNSLDRYDETTGVRDEPEKIRRSINIIKESGVEHEFRTTVVRGLHTGGEMKRIGLLIKGSRFAIQNFRPSKELLNAKFFDVKPFDAEELESFKKILEKYAPAVEVRA
jgi:pyruvate formate lyase activating enzyme